MIEADNVKIELHADDYGETVNTSLDILEHVKKGNLDGFSLLTNFGCFDECASLLKEAVKLGEMPFLPFISIHVDVVEGRMLSKVDSLAGSGNIGNAPLIPWTWSDLFLASNHIPVNCVTNDSDFRIHKAGYKEVYGSLKSEIAAQIAKGYEFIDEIQKIAAEAGVPYTPQKLRVDSHQHTHMLPIVWKALMEVIRESGYEVDYIRNSHEPLGVFLKATNKGISWDKVNIIKNRILTFYAPKVEKYLRHKGIYPMYAWGLVMSGRMDMERIKAVMPAMLDLCKKDGRSLELIIHPGSMLETEMTPEIPEETAKGFLMDEGRRIESDTVSVFHEYVSSL